MQQRSQSENQSSVPAASRWFRWPLMLSFAGAAAVVAIAAAPVFGVTVPPLFGAEQQTIHAALLVAVAIVGAGICIPALGILFDTERRLAGADSALASADAALVHGDAQIDVAVALLPEAKDGESTADSRADAAQAG